MKFVIVSGLSGAGKSTVLSILEDSGFFCVDNLPPVLIPKFAELCLAGTRTYEQVAMVCDVRAGSTTVHDLFAAVEALQEMCLEYEILFVESDVGTVIKRYKETRRSHPLAENGESLPETVERERNMLVPLRERANHVMDTTALSTAKLKDRVLSLFAPQRERTEDLKVSVTSFGFKYGVPMEADLVFDVRFLPNPHYDLSLRHLTGLDEPVRAYVFRHQETEEFMTLLCQLLDFLLPQYVEEGKSALVIAVGCTGGHHRSVAITHALAEHIRTLGYTAGENHRDMTRA